MKLVLVLRCNNEMDYGGVNGTRCQFEENAIRQNSCRSGCGAVYGTPRDRLSNKCLLFISEEGRHTAVCARVLTRQHIIKSSVSMFEVSSLTRQLSGRKESKKAGIHRICCLMQVEQRGKLRVSMWPE
ncbi:uncharacterized protein LOC117282457 isoform X2 [Cryptotermes secundus]|uniref:uncharacterized protein LOC117282457 isoform X2 n=1 Tax=Cryptotermes secundus TaxID=105785 RepID=UPI001454E327|nr:uncharacterized protein LOC117282457 isoform X2 [Cryptotermes secundus]